MPQDLGSAVHLPSYYCFQNQSVYKQPTGRICQLQSFLILQLAIQLIILLVLHKSRENYSSTEIVEQS